MVFNLVYELYWPWKPLSSALVLSNRLENIPRSRYDRGMTKINSWDLLNNLCLSILRFVLGTIVAPIRSVGDVTKHVVTRVVACMTTVVASSSTPPRRIRRIFSDSRRLSRMWRCGRSVSTRCLRYKNALVSCECYELNTSDEAWFAFLAHAHSSLQKKPCFGVWPFIAIHYHINARLSKQRMIV